MIYVFSHRDFSYYPKDINKYCSMSFHEINTPFINNIVITDPNILNHQWCYAEIIGTEYLYRNIDSLEDTIGMAHYRDWFDDDELSDYDAILPIPENYNMRSHYSGCHGGFDYECAMNIIKGKYPDYNIESEHLYTRNMFIMKKEHFIKYCEFLFYVLNEFNRINNCYTDEDVKRHVSENIEKYGCRDVNYQTRLQGYLAERVGTIFFNNYFSDKKVKKVHVTMLGKWQVK